MKVLKIISLICLLFSIVYCSTTILSKRGKIIQQTQSPQEQQEDTVIELIVKGKCVNYKEKLMKSIFISKQRNDGCLPISLTNSTKDFNNMKASFSCVDLDQNKSLFKIFQITPKQQTTRTTIEIEHQQEEHQQKYQQQNIERYVGEEEKQVLIVSLVLENEFIESKRKYSYLKRPSCAFKKDLCSSNQFIDHCKQNKVSFNKDDGFVSEGKQRVYLIPPFSKVSQCFVESACCSYISNDNSFGICSKIDEKNENENENRQCDDGNVCTFDKYESERKGCVFTPIKCDDEDACTVDSCHPELGCVFNVLNCDDDDPCTVDSCHSQKGCIHTKVDCDDGDECTLDKCNSLSGKCENTEINTAVCLPYFANPIDTNCDDLSKLYSSTCDDSLTYEQTTGACYSERVAPLEFKNIGQRIPNVVMKSFTFVAYVKDIKYPFEMVNWYIRTSCLGDEIPKCFKENARTDCTFLKEYSNTYSYSCTVKIEPSCDLRTGGPYYLNFSNLVAGIFFSQYGVLKKDRGCGCYLDETIKNNFATLNLKIN